MSEKIDDYDRAILRHLQQDAAQSIESLAEKVHLSRNACWRRVKGLEQAGIIKARVALLDPGKVGLGLLALVLIRTSAHEPGWAQQFQRAIKALPQIQSAYRTAGDLDYVLIVRVADMAAYDAFYQALIQRVSIADVSTSFVMEALQEHTAVNI